MINLNPMKLINPFNHLGESPKIMSMNTTYEQKTENLSKTLTFNNLHNFSKIAHFKQLTGYY